MQHDSCQCDILLRISIFNIFVFCKTTGAFYEKSMYDIYLSTHKGAFIMNNLQTHIKNYLEYCQLQKRLLKCKTRFPFFLPKLWYNGSKRIKCTQKRRDYVLPIP